MYSVCILGAGSIGALKDNEYDKPGGNAILTHAHAFHAHPDTEIVAFVDDNLTRAIQASRKWNGYAFESIAYMLHDASEIKPDIIVVATPTVTHRDMLMQVLKLKPKLVVAEKPFCSSLKEARAIHDAYTAAKIPIVVNYIRRFDPIGGQMFDDLRDGVYGKIWHARCLYGRGLRRDGCHGLDAFDYVLGQPTGLLIDRPGIDDGCEPGDLSYNITLEYQKDGHKVKAQMVAVDSRAWGAFEMEFICERGVVSFPQWGKQASIRKAETEQTFGQYQALGWPAELAETALNKAMLYLADNCVRHLQDGEPLRCTSANAIAVHEILEQIK